MTDELEYCEDCDDTGWLPNDWDDSPEPFKVCPWCLNRNDEPMPLYYVVFELAEESRP